MASRENLSIASRTAYSRSQLLTLIESDLMLTRTFMDIEFAARVSGSLEHADKTGRRVEMAFVGLKMLLDRAESMQIAVAAHRKRLGQLESEWESVQ